MVELRNVTKIIKHNTIIDNVNLTIKTGKIIGLHGINGSGKTMLMRLIAGLIVPTEGEVLIDGKVLGQDIDFPASLGLLLENPAFLGTYNAIDNLKLLADIKGEIEKKEIEDAIERVGLTYAKDKKYRKYSLGMKQRLGIAAAIMEKPKLLLLDEPTNSLDTEGIEMVKQVIFDEKQRGATIVISCHDNEILTELADEIYHIEVGKITGKSEKNTGERNET